MLLRGLYDEDFINYKKPSMFLIFPYCSLKCNIEAGIDCCQNQELYKTNYLNIEIDDIINRYLNNDISQAIVCGGLEPFDSANELITLIQTLREKYHCSDDIVIYTGYNEFEIKNKIDYLKKFKNIIIKFGRYIPNSKSKFDEVLGVTLASDNQYAVNLDKE